MDRIWQNVNHTQCERRKKNLGNKSSSKKKNPAPKQEKPVSTLEKEVKEENLVENSPSKRTPEKKKKLGKVVALGFDGVKVSVEDKIVFLKGKFYSLGTEVEVEV